MLKKLVKILKVWELFFDIDKIKRIEETIQLSDHEPGLLSQEDIAKVQKFKDEFCPDFNMMPLELIESK